MKAVTLVGGLLVSILTITPAFAQSVPAVMLGKALLSPIDFASALAEANIPAGLETFEGELRPSAKPDVSDRSGGSVDLSSCVDLFNHRHTDHRAELLEGVVVIRPVSDRAPFLDRVVTVPPGSIDGIFEALYQLFSRLQPSLATGGRAGSSMASRYQRGDDVPVVFDGQPKPVVNIMGAIVRSAWQQAWLVTTRRDGDEVQIVRIGFIHSEGTRTTLGIGPR